MKINYVVELRAQPENINQSNNIHYLSDTCSINYSAIIYLPDKAQLVFLDMLPALAPAQVK